MVLSASGSRMNGLQTRTMDPFNLQTRCNSFTPRGRSDMGADDGDEDEGDDKED